jgi:hypothetical protein
MAFESRRLLARLADQVRRLAPDSRELWAPRPRTVLTRVDSVWYAEAGMLAPTVQPSRRCCGD